MKIYDRLVAAIGAQLAKDGFTNRSDVPIFVRPITGPWRAWISVPGNSSALDPMVGIMNDELNDIYFRARTTMGKNLPPQSDGPPLLMVQLERLAAYSADAPWEYHEKILTEDVANDLVVCLRKFAYPFFEKYASLQGVMDGSKERMPGFAFPWYAPIILIKLGRLDDARTYGENYARHLPDDEHAAEFRNYVAILFKMLLR